MKNAVNRKLKNTFFFLVFVIQDPAHHALRLWPKNVHVDGQGEMVCGYLHILFYWLAK